MKHAVPPISLAGAQLADVRHVCAFFNTADEAYRVLLPFIQEGFAHGDKAIHVVAERHCAEHASRLATAGIDTEAAERKRQLDIRTSAATYLHEGRFDQDRMLALFRGIAGGHATDGFPRSRIVCQMDWAAEARIDVEDLVEFESRVNEVWCEHDDAVICTYNLTKFGGDVVIDMVRTHPLVIIGGILHQNPFYVPPGRFLRELRERRRRQGGRTGA